MIEPTPSYSSDILACRRSGKLYDAGHFDTTTEEAAWLWLRTGH